MHQSINLNCILVKHTNFVQEMVESMMRWLKNVPDEWLNTEFINHQPCVLQNISEIPDKPGHKENDNPVFEQDNIVLRKVYKPSLGDIDELPAKENEDSSMLSDTEVETNFLLSKAVKEEKRCSSDSSITGLKCFLNILNL